MTTPFDVHQHDAPRKRTGETLLPQGGTLLMLGNVEQRQQFAEAFEPATR